MQTILYKPEMSTFKLKWLLFPNKLPNVCERNRIQALDVNKLHISSNSKTTNADFIMQTRNVNFNPFPQNDTF